MKLPAVLGTTVIAAAAALCLAMAPVQAPKQTRVPGTYWVVGSLEEGEAPVFTSWLQQVNAAGIKNPEVIISSPGGDLDALEAMSEAIEKSKVPVTCVARGKVSSAAALLFEACHRRVMEVGSRLLFHSVRGNVHGMLIPEVAMMLTMDLIQTNEQWLTWLAKKTGIAVDALRPRISAGAEWIVTADMAVASRVADVVEP